MIDLGKFSSADSPSPQLVILNAVKDPAEKPPAAVLLELSRCSVCSPAAVISVCPVYSVVTILHF
jgi:hypothetical protein